MMDRIVTFGGRPPLTGFLSSPQSATGPAVVFINAGIVHRVGPHRLYVELARMLSASGMPTMRFDLSGVGDGRPPAQDKGYEDNAVSDVLAAVDHMKSQRLTSRGCVLLGLCSGSEHAYKAAMACSDVTAVVLLDPHSYPSLQARLERAASKVADPERWGRKIGRILGRGDGDLGPAEDDQFAAVIDRPDPPQSEWAASLATLLDRGTAIYIRYTRFVEEHLTRPEHFFQTFRDVPKIDSVVCDVDMAADHTYTERQARQRMMDSVLTWLQATNK